MIKKVLNPKASLANTLVLVKSESGCCGDVTGVDCKYTATFATSATYVSFTFKSAKTGENVTYPLASSVTTKKQIEKVMNAALKAEGYTMVGGQNVRLAVSGSNDVLSIYGEAEFVNVITSAGTTVFVKTCTSQYQCDFKFYTAGSTTLTGVLDGVAYNVGNMVYGTQSASTLRTALLSAIPTALSVTVVANTASSLWEVTIKLPADSEISLNSVDGVRCNCEVDFV